VAARNDWHVHEKITTVFRWKRKNVGQQLAFLGLKTPTVFKVMQH
jgi:hypothetical protein